uniref:Orf56 n=1 Tax=Cajanus cajan TaxID=3821 RepID=A0A1S5RW67_CAJCA|nr:orf56 [Cajanus cajan]AOY40608.1 orf56 [Cajanus cajan]
MWFRRIQLQENRERRTPPPLFFRPTLWTYEYWFLRMSDCPSPTLTVQPESGSLIRSAI